MQLQSFYQVKTNNITGYKRSFLHFGFQLFS